MMDASAAESERAVPCLDVARWVTARPRGGKTAVTYIAGRAAGTAAEGGFKGGLLMSAYFF